MERVRAERYLQLEKVPEIVDNALRELIESKPINAAEFLSHHFSDARQTPTTAMEAWSRLSVHYKEIGRNLELNTLFLRNPSRAEQFHQRIELADGQWIVLDYSKNLVTTETMDILRTVAVQSGLLEQRQRMFEGSRINCTENRSVLHVALRNHSRPVFVDQKDVSGDVKGVLDHMRSFVRQVHTHQKCGQTGKPFKHVVNVGIGGSDLGPKMVTTALEPFRHGELQVYFVSNVDGAHLSTILSALDPETTLFIVASKTFTTQETMTNASSAKSWLVDYFDKKGLGSHEIVSKHFVALSTNVSKVVEFGILKENIFEFWDWVGGRFSLWSAIGLSIALYVGMEHFEELLRGASEMDVHFLDSPPETNIPLTLALLGVWYNNFYNFETHAVLPYDQSLMYLAPYLQQAEMESNGKTITRDGRRVNYSTGAVLWGKPGTNGQHAFYQLLHQGTKVVPCDFICPLESAYPIRSGLHHSKLFANFVSQTEALMVGKSEKVVRRELEVARKSADEINRVAPHKTFCGNKPSNSLVLSKLTPATLGSLLALYEHKIFCQGVLWQINSFDQWGVELGKQLAASLLPQLQPGRVVESFDCSTNALLNLFNKESCY
eukprot:NODE_540_length_2120_cov_49.946403_g498_i0.p1 GENE.NODE_540_length_2120_cov_49.946403_g498_i0~~NODE_540_length_2120_cov_49.946403_g498_i0.p1  ORF type:complete len:607 (-),score=91.58 NODE_540_length_2120_cov_49.946403_g498_i0:237-2057(-)